MMATQSETVVIPIQEKENATAEIIPSEANFDDDISDLDLLSVICGVQENINNIITVTNTSYAPRAMFANCKIGAININIKKVKLCEEC